ncbi:hypothetical protein NLX86_26775 [Streptomyces sp. A3M-1-3]|uniref:hypothetical protein n=1 Tax=Streptomyces sp. A3M-1-3 TaxID=2962044 RepID=UPI0020B7F81F|nr:hypothetical protein [Streptomyces sp. A3M-1-3]MCP3821565.1 hypothetical protein [Streptomyces sp. A3M-1-3]
MAAPATAAQSDDGHGDKCGRNELDISSAVVDSGPLQGTQFRSATNWEGNAFLNDSRNVGAWINLEVLPGAPQCVVDTAVSATESTSTVRLLFVNLMTTDGLGYQAVCTYGPTPFTGANLASACGPGFIPIPGTPV